MQELKQNIIKHFANDEDGKKVYAELSKTLAFSDDIYADAKNQIAKIVKDMTKLISNYKPTVYGTQEEYDNLGN